MAWKGNKGVHTFSKSINPKVKVIAQLELELTYYISHHATGTPPPTLFDNQ